MKIQIHKINEFKSLLTGVSQDLIKAGKLLVEMVEQDENAYERIMSECRVSLSFLEALENVGRGRLDPLFLTDPSPAAQRIVSQAVPKKIQDTLVKSLVQVVTQENGGFKVEHKRYDELTPRQAVRVIRDGKISTVQEQQALIQEEIAERAIRRQSYVIMDNKVYFREANRGYTWDELAKIEEKIRPRADDLEETIKGNQIRK